MAGTIKPTNFPMNGLPLTGEEELYSQTGGTNTKFLVSEIWDGNPPTIINSGDTFNNYDTVNIYSGNTIITNNSGATIYLTDVVIQSGITAEMVDNLDIDGTYIFQNGTITGNTIIIKPVDYSYVEIKTGQKWVDGKPIYRKVIQLPQWTLGSEGAFGQTLLGAGQSFDIMTRMDMFAKISGGGITYGVLNLNTGDGSNWSGSLYALYDGINSKITWENIFIPSDIILYNPIIYFILEYTKP